HERHRRRDLSISAAFELRVEELERRRIDDALGFRPTYGQEAAELLAASEQIALLLAVLRELAVRNARDLLVRDRHVEAIAERLEIVLVALLLLLGDVLPFAGRADAEALDGLRENDRRAPLVNDGLMIGGVHLDRVVAAPVQPPDVVVGHIG